MPRFARLALAVLLVGALDGTALASPVGSVPSPAPRFHVTACPKGTFPTDRDVDCGFVVVPEDRSKPDGRRIRVAVAVVHATDPTPAPDPIVYVDGGPSVGAIQPSTLDTYFQDASYAAHRDLVVVDTRGTGLSRPRLGCFELDRADPRAFYSGSYVYARAPRITGRALGRCWDRLTGRGIDLAAYNSAESAADLDAIRVALGIDRWNMLALSADGTLGMTYLRLFPGSLRSAVFDSPTPANVEWGPDFLRGDVDVVNRVLAGCEANRACRSTYPGLRRAFYRTVRRLNRHPVDVAIPAFRPEPVTVRVDGAGLMNDFSQNVWPGGAGSHTSIPWVLHNAWLVSHGRLAHVYRGYLGTGPAGNPHQNSYLAAGKTMSYVCHDLVGFLSMADRRRAAQDDPWNARRILGRHYDLGQGWNDAPSPAGCAHWPVGRAGPKQHQVVHSDVPTLVLTGAYDPVVPARATRRMLPGLTDGTYVELPTSGHVQLATYARDHRCARRITAQFLAAPDAAPDTGCVARVPPLDYTPPGRTPGTAPGLVRGSPGEPDVAARRDPAGDRGAARGR